MKLDNILIDEISFNCVPKNLYYLKNISKYLGNTDRLQYESILHLEQMKYLDENELVLYWEYRPLNHVVKFYNKYIKQYEYYIPTFYAMFKRNSYDKIDEYLMELDDNMTDLSLIDEEDYKMLSPDAQKKYEGMLTLISYYFSKYKTVKNYCKSKGMKFQILTKNGDVREIIDFNKLRMN